MELIERFQPQTSPKSCKMAPTDEEARTAAAAKMQALQRGKKARKATNEKAAAAAAAGGAEGEESGSKPRVSKSGSGKKLLADKYEKGTESISVFARLKPTTKPRGEIEIKSRFGKQKSVQVRKHEFSLE